jgi:hypothetical protein
MPTEFAMPKDSNGASAQVLAPEETTVVQGTIGAGNDRVAIPTDADIVEITCTDTTRCAFGTVTVDATAGTKRILLAGTYTYKVPSGATHVAFTRVGASSGNATVAKLV